MPSIYDVIPKIKEGIDELGQLIDTGALHPNSVDEFADIHDRGVDIIELHKTTFDEFESIKSEMYPF